MVGLQPREAEAAVRQRSVQLYHCHTGETFNAVYFADGRYLPEALQAATHHLRDWRDNTARPIDPQLLDLLWSLRADAGHHGADPGVLRLPLAQTNAMLRRTHFGAARNSLHMQAMAVDLFVPEPTAAAVRAAAVQLKAGGVGYYPALRLRSRRYRRHPLLVGARQAPPDCVLRTGTLADRHHRVAVRPG